MEGDMARTQWPSNDELRKLVEQTGSVAAAARSLGVARTTLRDRLLNESVLTTIEIPEVNEADLLRERNRQLEAQVNQMRRTSISDEAALRRIEGAVQVAVPTYTPPPPAKISGTEHEMSLLLSDLHAGEVVFKDQTLGLNEYSWPVMLDRLAKIQKAVLSYKLHRPYPIRTLNIWMLGDMLSGTIHDDLALTNEFADTEAIAKLSADLAVWSAEFGKEFERVNICGVPGNHPRRSKKPMAKNAFNNDDWLTYYILGVHLKDCPNVTVQTTRAAFLTTEVMSRRVLLMHGDGIRSSMPGVPWGGVIRRVTTLEQQFAKAGQPIDYVCMGHFHTDASINGVGTRTLLNGSVKGVDEYSLKEFGSGRPASQVLLTFHPKNGLTDVSIIDLQ